MTYSQFIFGLSKTDFELDRKILSEIAISEPQTFNEIVNAVKAKL